MEGLNRLYNQARDRIGLMAARYTLEREYSGNGLHSWRIPRDIGAGFMLGLVLPWSPPDNDSLGLGEVERKLIEQAHEKIGVITGKVAQRFGLEPLISPPIFSAKGGYTVLVGLKKAS